VLDRTNHALVLFGRNHGAEADNTALHRLRSRLCAATALLLLNRQWPKGRRANAGFLRAPNRDRRGGHVAKRAAEQQETS
jgi:hypothetical protein